MNNEDKKEDKENKKEKEEKISTNKIENEKSEITIKQQKIDTLISNIVRDIYNYKCKRTSTPI